MRSFHLVVRLSYLHHCCVGCLACVVALVPVVVTFGAAIAFIMFAYVIFSFPCACRTATRTPLPPPVCQAYKVADHLRTCPPVERMTLPLYPQERLSPVQIAHFAACLRSVFMCVPCARQRGLAFILSSALKGRVLRLCVFELQAPSVRNYCAFFLCMKCATSLVVSVKSVVRGSCISWFCLLQACRLHTSTALCDLGRLEEPYSLEIIIVCIAVPVFENALMRQAPLFSRSQLAVSFFCVRGCPSTVGATTNLSGSFHILDNM